MNDRALRADQRLHGLLDQILAGLHEALDRDVIGDAPFLDEAAVEGELGVRGRWKSDLDFLEPTLHQRVEELEFLRDIHRHGQGLVAIAEIDAAPDRRGGQCAAGPLALRNRDGRERTILAARWKNHL